METDLQRNPIQSKGLLWEPYTGNYDIDPEIYMLLDDRRNIIFAYLKPQVQKQNAGYRELNNYGRNL